MSKKEDILKNLRLELRKGTLVLAVLSQLKTKHYGYSLVELLNKNGLNIDQNTLYPLLRRLNKQEILVATWDTVTESRPRKYYMLSALGIEVLQELTIEFKNNFVVLEHMLKEEL